MIKKLLFVWIAVLYAGAAVAQSEPVIDGQWEIEKVAYKLYAQEDGRVLEEKVITTQAEYQELNGVIPLKMTFATGAYLFNLVYGTEKGDYEAGGAGRILLYGPVVMANPGQQLPRIPSRTMAVKKLTSNVLELSMQDAFYKDNSRKVSVKLSYVCYYKRTS